MATYAIGDVQGCHSSLCRLLDKLDFDPALDELWFTGDLVNRGPDSAAVIRFIKSLPATRIVLGNHDLHLLAVAEGLRPCKSTDTFADVLNADDRGPLLNWLRRRPLAQFDEQKNVLMVHAGLHPKWELKQALDYAHEVEALLHNDETYTQLLSLMYGDKPASLSRKSGRFDRARVIINALTRIRYCDDSGRMDFSQVGPPGSQSDGLYPWYKLASLGQARVVFGHWSTLGSRLVDNFISLDSGCVHGGCLSAVDLEQATPRFLQVECVGKN